MVQLVYETNLNYDVTRKRVQNSDKVEKCLDFSKGNFEFRLKDDKNIKRIMITLTGKVMIYCENVSALEGSLPSIKSLTPSYDEHESLWSPGKPVDSALMRKTRKYFLEIRKPDGP
jgi:hypothetical protein